MKKGSGPGTPKPGERTGTVCPVCGDAVLRQEVVARNGAVSGQRLICSKRGCPWQGSAR